MPPFKTCKRQQECINYEEQIEIILVLLASELWGSLSVEMIVANSAAVELMTVSSGHQSDIISFIMRDSSVVSSPWLEVLYQTNLYLFAEGDTESAFQKCRWTLFADVVVKGFGEMWVLQ